MRSGNHRSLATIVGYVHLNVGKTMMDIYQCMQSKRSYCMLPVTEKNLSALKLKFELMIPVHKEAFQKHSGQKRRKKTKQNKTKPVCWLGLCC